jgi:hypothetical protein
MTKNERIYFITSMRIARERGRLLFSYGRSRSITFLFFIFHAFLISFSMSIFYYFAQAFYKDEIKLYLFGLSVKVSPFFFGFIFLMFLAYTIFCCINSDRIPLRVFLLNVIISLIIIYFWFDYLAFKANALGDVYEISGLFRVDITYSTPELFEAFIKNAKSLGLKLSYNECHLMADDIHNVKQLHGALDKAVILQQRIEAQKALTWYMKMWQHFKSRF